MASKSETITIKGQPYTLDEFSIGDKRWIWKTFGDEMKWNKLLGVEREPECIAATTWQFLSKESRAKFPGGYDEFIELLPGDLNYLLLLYMKLVRIYGIDYPDFSSYNMEKVSELEMKEIQAKVDQWREDKGLTDKVVAEVKAENPSPSATPAAA